MKIRSKIALRYAAVTAILMLVFAVVIYILSAKSREKEFYDGLVSEGISKANLFFTARVDPQTMQSIYKSNIKYINEVEVAIYDKKFNLLYHDAKDIDIVKETPELLGQVLKEEKNIKFYVNDYQAVVFLFVNDNTEYIVTAAAYDGYGYAKQLNLALSLLVICIVSIGMSFIIGYILAKRALKPVADISDRMKDITANNLDLRLLGYNENDEFGELAGSFNKALDIIETSFDSQKMFVSNVSHELRTPLSVIIGEIDWVLLKDRTLEEYKQTLVNSHKDTSRLIKLLNGLLNLAKASYDENKISKTNVRIDEVLLDARDIVLKGNSDYYVNLLFDEGIQDDSEITIVGNEYLLKMAFANLMDNNCKFSENRTSRVYIGVEEKKIIIRFSDTGIGIPEIELHHVFAPFYRGENKKIAQGNGIGLALVSKVISLHKGSITIQSKSNEGTTFEVIFNSIQS